MNDGHVVGQPGKLASLVLSDRRLSHKEIDERARAAFGEVFWLREVDEVMMMVACSLDEVRDVIAELNETRSP